MPNTLDLEELRDFLLEAALDPSTTEKRRELISALVVNIDEELVAAECGLKLRAARPQFIKETRE